MLDAEGNRRKMIPGARLTAQAKLFPGFSFLLLGGYFAPVCEIV